MILLRLAGWLLLLAGLMVLGRDLIGWWDVGVYAPASLDELWRELHRTSYGKIHGALSPMLLRLWAAPGLAVPGLVLIWLGGLRRAGTHRRRRATRRPS